VSLATLVLVAALCSDGPEKLCTYMDVTERMQVQTDDQCFQMAAFANAPSIGKPDTPRWACVSPAQYKKLIGDSEPIKLTRKPEVL
jgi:hypothetical protein